MVGKTISHYKILEKLGEGGMGVVYKAQDTTLDRIIALKFLPDRVNKDETAKARFLQEAKAAAGLNHPNICTIFGVEEFEGQLYMAMELIDGKTIRETIQAGAIPFETAADYAVQIAEALEEAHSKGIVHRDIKADNIMINSKNQIKVMDFGLAKLKGSLKLTRTSSTVGTLAYMAPEQIQGGEVDPRSDIFAFGVLFFEMLSGRLPFRGEHEAAMMYSIINEDPDDIQKYVAGAPPELSFLIRTALEKNPDDRFQHMSDIVRDLRRLKKQSSRVNRPAYSGEYQKYEAAQSQKTSMYNTVGQPKSRRNLFLYGGIVLGIVIIAVAAFFLITPKEEMPFSSIQFTRITSTGKIRSAAISPDGRYIAYSQFDKGKYSLWVRLLATSSNIQIRPPQEFSIVDPVFSADGNFVYYLMNDANTLNPSLYKIPVLGGNPIRILNDVQSPVTFSPDGKRFAFTRYYSSSGNFALVVASADGSQQKDLAAHKGNLWIEGSPSWSPDGTTIAACLGSWKGGAHFEVIGIDAASGEETQLTKNTWDAIRKVQWLSNGKGIVVEATSINTTLTQLYLISYPSGDVSKITNDLNSYSGTTLTNDFQKICTVQDEREIYLYLVPDGDEKKAKKITSLRDDGVVGVAVGDDNNVYYSSRQSGSFDIWTVGLNGENQRQVTFDEFLEMQISVSPDGHKLFFNSNKGGIPNIWSINTDGSGLLQLTKGAEDYDPQMDPAGEWVYCDSWFSGPQTIVKIKPEGGERVPVTTTNGAYPVITHDGKYILYQVSDEKRKSNSIYKIPAAGGKSEFLFDLPKHARNSIVLRPKSNEISYVVTNEGISNIFVRQIAGTSEKQYTHFDEGLIVQFAWTPDGKSVIVSRGDVRSDVVIISDEQNK